jgi:hypothetical protein
MNHAKLRELARVAIESGERTTGPAPGESASWDFDCAASPTVVLSLLDEIENQRVALRRHCIVDGSFGSLQCNQCHEHWCGPVESHAPDCLARPPA